MQFGSADTQEDKIVLGHPKLEKLRDMVLEHFRSKQEGEATRVMIFSQVGHLLHLSNISDISCGPLQLELPGRGLLSHNSCSNLLEQPQSCMLVK